LCVCRVGGYPDHPEGDDGRVPAQGPALHSHRDQEWGEGAQKIIIHRLKGTVSRDE